MRIAIVSDIHANLQAWNAVLLDIGSSRIDRIICLGDSVGYGPDPAAVLESVYNHAHHVVLGNHDAAVCGKLDESLFHEAAAEIVRWTRGELNRSAMDFLKSLPLTLAGQGFRCSHGDFGEPAAFEYVIDPEDAMPSWQSVDDPLLFVGHSHDPAIFVLGQSGTPHRVPPQEFVLEPGKRFLVNVGSVGQPRDGDARACYVIYDTTEKALFWRRIPFDIDAYAARLAETPIPPATSYFLRADPRADIPPVRELLRFAPPRETSQHATDVVEVAELELLNRRVRRWKQTAVIVLTAATLSLVGGTAAIWHHVTRGATIPPAEAESRPAASMPIDAGNVLLFPEAPIETPAPMTGWRIRLGNHRRQRVGWSDDGQSDTFTLWSGDPRRAIILESVPIDVKPGMRFQLRGMTRPASNTIGTVRTTVNLWKQEDGEIREFAHYEGSEPDEHRVGDARGDWKLARDTFDVPANTIRMTVGLEATFEGRIDVSGVSLERRE